MRAQAEAVRKARAIVAGEVGVLEGCIPLASLAHNAVADWRIDPDFVNEFQRLLKDVGARVVSSPAASAKATAP